MITAFLIIGALAALLVLAWVLRPVWRSKAIEDETSPAVNAKNAAPMSGDEAARLAVYRDRRLEIDREREAGRLSEEESARLQQELVDDVAREFGQLEKNAAAPANPWAASTLALIGLALAVSVYLVVGSPSLVDSAKVAQQMEDSRDPVKVIATMEARVKAKPADAEAWSVLASVYKFTGDVPKSLAAYETLFKLVPPQDKDAALPLAEYAEVLAISNGNEFKGKPVELLTQALKLDPTEPKALAMMGAAQFRAGNFKEARTYLARLIEGMPADSPEAAQLKPLLDKIDERISTGGAAPAQSTAAAGPAIEFTGQATLSAKAREASAWNDVKTVFVSVRPATPGAPPMPLAALRLDKGNAANDWPLSFAIGDAQAMNQQTSLAQAGPVLIEVHLSRTGQPGKKSGDWYGRLSGLDGAKGRRDKLDLQIDQQQP